MKLINYLKSASDLFCDGLDKPYSRLHIYSDGGGWVLDRETQELAKIADALGCKVKVNARKRLQRRSVYYTSMFQLERPETFGHQDRTCFDYFHGNPHKHEEFVPLFRSLQKNHNNINRIRVSHSGMEEIILESGIDGSKIFRIPIGIRLEYFPRQTPELKKGAREKLGIPQNMILIGSFQKDGNGWGEGLEPKLIKGPDVFVKAIQRLKLDIPEVGVLLTGPARGFVKKNLTEMNIPYFHTEFKSYEEIASCYHALDAYMVASREEGGPKSVLESMATGIPLVTTRVGQAIDLVSHQTNGCMVESEDIEALSFYTKKVLGDLQLRQSLIQNGYLTAVQNSYESQIPLWKGLLTGFVEFD